MTEKEFVDTYWKYYISLENDFKATEKYVALDEVNAKTFSVEYLKLFQIICAEIDVLAKVFCGRLDPSFNKDTFPHYCKLLTNKFQNFASENVRVNPLNIVIKPWQNWTYNDVIDNNGKLIRVTGSGPKWWSEHNNVKHSRTLKSNNELNYKKCNQKNVLYSLAALFQLESYVYKEITQNDKVAYEPSQYFKMNDWEEVVLPMTGMFASVIEKK